MRADRDRRRRPTTVDVPLPEAARARRLASSAAPPSWTRSPRSWRSSRRQSCAASCITGEPGIGKTSLLAAFADRWPRPRRGDRRLRTLRRDRGCHCSRSGSVLRLLRRARSRRHAHRARRPLRRGAAAHLPDPRARGSTTTPDPTTSDDATERFLTFEAAGRPPPRIAARAAARPDARRPPVGRTDRAAAACVTSRASWPTTPVLLVLSSRDVDGEHESEELRPRAGRARARRDASAAARRPRRRRAGGARRRARCRSADGAEAAPGRAGARIGDTAGNPLYASQLIRHWTRSRAPTDSSRRACATSSGAGSTRSAMRRRAC